MKKNSNFHSNRIIFLLILFLLISFVIFSRLFYVQVVKSEEYTKMALEYNKNVICEKPFTSTLKECNELCNIAKRKGLFLREQTVEGEQ